MSKFWPALKNNKMTSDYDNNGYTPTYDYHDFVIKNYFLKEEGQPLPDVPDTYFTLDDNDQPHYITFTVEVRKFKGYKYFDWQKVNWFLSDFNGLHNKVEWSFWHVMRLRPLFNKYNELVGITYWLKLDVWSTLYYTIWYYSGIVNIQRLHNKRYRQDNIFNSPYLIFDYIDNEYIKYCDDFCINVTQKTQLEKSQVLISSRNFEPKTNTKIDTLDTKWNRDTGLVNVNKKFCLLIWTISGEEGSASKQQWTQINDYLQPMKLYIYLQDKDPYTEIQDVYKYIGETLSQRVQFANICEFIFKESELKQVNNRNYIYELKNGKMTLEDEYYSFVDVEKIVTSKLFFNPNDLTNSPTVKWQNEPHIFTNKHYEIKIELYNKQPITIDVVSLLLNSKAYEKIEFFTASNSLKLIKRRGFVSPEGMNLTNMLLDADTSISHKKDSGFLTMPIQGNYDAPWWGDAFLEFMRTNNNQKNAGINAIQKEAQLQQGQQLWNVGKGTLGGLIGGGLQGGPAGMILGGGAGGLVSGANAIFNNHQIKERAKYQLEQFNAYYDDMKNSPSNQSTGNPSTSQADIEFARIDDENNIFNYMKLWTPKLTVLEVKDYEKQNIAYHINKYGYPQNRWLKIKSFNDLMIRKYWNQTQITNIDEFFKQDQIPDYLCVEVMDALSKKNGARFWNLEQVMYENIYNYDINNYEKELDNSMVKLESPLYG